MIQEIPKDTPPEEIGAIIVEMIRQAPPGATIEILCEADDAEVDR
jgi:hypothetical protein